MKYYILNQKYSPEAYEKKSKEILGDRDALAQFEQEFKKLVLASPKEHLHNVTVENSYTNYAQNGRNVQLSYLIMEGNDCKYCSGAGLNSE